jgi:DNA-binding LytR/AlgR family response regulator
MNATITPPVLAILADDERLLREQLKARLAQAWPDLQICGEAHDGREAVEMVARARPDIVFLDIRMPVMTGIEAAREIALLPDLPCEVVFVTAYDQYAIEAFEQGALDYVLKPAEPARLVRTVERLRARLAAKRQQRTQDTSAEAADPASFGLRLAQIEQLLRSAQPNAPRYLRWLQSSRGNTLKLVPVDEVLFFRSDEKYTRVQTLQAEWLIRTPLRELLEQLDTEQFWQVHRSTIVNARAIERLERDDAGHLRIRISGHQETLEVSRSFSQRFRQM